MRIAVIALMLVLMVSIMGCTVKQPAPAEEPAVSVEPSAETTQETVDDLEEEIASLDSLEDDLDLSELDALDEELKI